MNININESGYRFEKHAYGRGLLEDGIDATYIIHLEGNGRYDHIQTQLCKHQPSKTVYIVFNKGYKTGLKPPYVNNPPRDLVDSNLQIFKHADQHKYGNILILEDDYFFNDIINDPIVCRDITAFICARKDKPFLYTLGCLPFLSIPWSWSMNHYCTPFFAATHACIFSKSYRIHILLDDHTIIWDWDQYTRIGFTYHQPICYQTFPETENKQHWGQEYESTLYFIVLICKNLLLYLKLDTQPEPGYSDIYAFSKAAFWFILVYYYISAIILFLFLKCLVSSQTREATKNDE